MALEENLAVIGRGSRTTASLELIWGFLARILMLPYDLSLFCVYAK